LSAEEIIIHALWRLLELKTALGAALLLQSTRSVSLNGGGTTLLESAGAALETIDRCIQPVDGAARGRLRVATSFSVARAPREPTDCEEKRDPRE